MEWDCGGVDIYIIHINMAWDCLWSTHGLYTWESPWYRRPVKESLRVRDYKQFSYQVL